MAYNFSEASKRKINSFLRLLKNELYDSSVKMEVAEAMNGIPNGLSGYIYRENYIIRFNFEGQIFYNGYRSFDLMHICTKMDDSGSIECIKIVPDKNQKTQAILDIVRRTGSLYGMNIYKVEEGEHSDSRVILFYVA